MPFSRCPILGAALGLGILLPVLSAPVRADEPARWLFDPVPAREIDNGTSARPNWIRLFRLEPAFPVDPPGLDADDPPGQAPPSEAGPDWFQVALGNDNPFFDLRRRGDPGGVGYYRLHTQAKLVDTYNTLFSFGMQAVTPAGRESNGLADGLTVVCPGLSVFHAFDTGTAVQGYLGKNFTLGMPSSYRLHRAARCAVAVQQPLGDEQSGLNNVFFFLEGLGSYRYESVTTDGPAARWDVLPGVHWKITDSWWMSSGVGVPVQPGGLERRFWQLTCSFQF